MVPDSTQRRVYPQRFVPVVPLCRETRFRGQLYAQFARWAVPAGKRALVVRVAPRHGQAGGSTYLEYKLKFVFIEFLWNNKVRQGVVRNICRVHIVALVPWPKYFGLVRIRGRTVQVLLHGIIVSIARAPVGGGNTIQRTSPSP